MSLESLRADLHAAVDRRLHPLTRGLSALGVQPNQVTVAGAAVSLASAPLLLAERPVLAGLVWLTGSAFDLLDGALARRQGRVSAAGAFLDSTLDRVAEGALFAAIAYHFAERGRPLEAALTVLALLGSLLISYTRARAEALGAQCKVGIVTRVERVLLLGIGLCFGLLAPAIYLLVALTAASAAQRIRHSLVELRRVAAVKEPPRVGQAP